ncbi:MerR family transcriptional regulator [Cellulomonas palmilytica]|uniref:MerR family transcriptional regulator n=1 Tax=Cellulomonas palmilytica TaxID=2608402 RepID=UPI001F27F5BC|nr:MerR family transcriptional regulator [Cellulomonas palmilytica]UJP39736.1 MerR family transcriptional regulator [Cellulomonas palmilytica]
MTLSPDDGSAAPERDTSDDTVATAAPHRHAAPLTVAAVAARLGVAPATLRTWDRRYGLGPSERSAGSHRRYSANDVERLLVMRRLTLDGVAPGDAARIASVTDVDERPQTGPTNVDRALHGVAAGGTGHVVPFGTGTPTALVDAALTGDAATCRALVALPRTAGVAEVEHWWTGLLEPALTELARRTVVDRPGQDAPLTVRAAAVEALRAWLPAAPRGGGVVLVLVPEGQERPLLVHALTAALVAAGVDARAVGGPTSVRHALELVVMTRPGAVVTVSRRADVDLAHVTHLAQAHPGLAQFVMLPDAGGDVPAAASVTRSRTFRGLLHEVLAVAGRTPNG